ncbi:cytochrome c [Gammaproteobacteria bacterium]|nr:cytochrome c [Gammaproteobacteria bacterium]
MRTLCFMSLGLCFTLINSPSMATPAQKDPTSSQAAMATGQRLFLDNCAECHQRNGRGLNGVYPSLVSSEVVRGSGVDVALQLIIGRGEMPSFAGAMGAAEMADLINYVRNAWGNEGDAIDAATVARLMR